MSKQCETSCETSQASCCESSQSCTSECGCPSEAVCPVEGAAEMWGGSFKLAMRQAQVDILKGKIIKAWGPMLERTADALVESMGAKWQLMIAKVRAAEACDGFKHQIRDLWLEEKKK